MSDISFYYTWWQLLLASPVIGWPGAIFGAILGATLGRRSAIGLILGMIIGAILGNVAWAFAVIYLK